MPTRQGLRPDAPFETRVLPDDQLDAVTGGTASLAAATGGQTAQRGRVLDCEGHAYLTGAIL